MGFLKDTYPSTFTTVGELREWLAQFSDEQGIGGHNGGVAVYNADGSGVDSFDTIDPSEVKTPEETTEHEAWRWKRLNEGGASMSTFAVVEKDLTPLSELFAETPIASDWNWGDLLVPKGNYNVTIHNDKLSNELAIAFQHIIEGPAGDLSEGGTIMAVVKRA